jgi:hypothetical protein
MAKTEPHPLIVELREALYPPDPDRIEQIVRRIDRELQHPNLWGAMRSAKELGISHTNLYKLDGLPKEARVYERGKMWSAYKIKDFAKARRSKAKAKTTTEGKDE